MVETDASPLCVRCYHPIEGNRFYASNEGPFCPTCWTSQTVENVLREAHLDPTAAPVTLKLIDAAHLNQELYRLTHELGTERLTATALQSELTDLRKELEDARVEIVATESAANSYAKEIEDLRKKLEEAEEWHWCMNGEPQRSGRYGVLYQYKDIPLRAFTGDYDAEEERWYNCPPDNKIVAWCEYPEIPDAMPPARQQVEEEGT